MSKLRYKVTLVCVPLEYLPFPVSMIRKSKFHITGICGDDHFTLFFISDENSNGPALLFYSFKSALKKYEKLTQKKLMRSEVLKAELLLTDGWLKLSSDPSNFEIAYSEDYFNGNDSVLTENKNKIAHPIICIRRDFLKEIDEDLDHETEKRKLLSEKSSLEKNISEENKIFEKKLAIRKAKI